MLQRPVKMRGELLRNNFKNKIKTTNPKSQILKIPFDGMIT